MNQLNGNLKKIAYYRGVYKKTVVIKNANWKKRM